MKRLLLAMLLALTGLATGCTDDDVDGSAAPQLEDGGVIPGEQ